MIENIREFFQYLRANTKWWLLPIVLSFLLITVLLVLSAETSSLAPFIYTIF